MSDYLTGLAASALGVQEPGGVRPRPVSRFEPPLDAFGQHGWLGSAALAVRSDEPMLEPASSSGSIETAQPPRREVRATRPRVAEPELDARQPPRDRPARAAEPGEHGIDGVALPAPRFTRATLAQTYSPEGAASMALSDESTGVEPLAQAAPALPSAAPPAASAQPSPDGVDGSTPVDRPAPHTAVAVVPTEVILHRGAPQDAISQPASYDTLDEPTAAPSRAGSAARDFARARAAFAGEPVHPAAPVVQVTIGRVEIRASGAQQRTPKPAWPEPPIGLAEYLRESSGGRK